MASPVASGPRAKMALARGGQQALDAQVFAGENLSTARPCRTTRQGRRVRRGDRVPMQDEASLPALDHAAFLRRAFDVARQARAHGNHPFGAILVGPDGAVLMEQENGYLPSRDMTAHAERVLATRACTTYAPAVLARCTLYSSAEPCAMCAGAIYWAGIGRLVYGLSEHRLRDLTGNHPANPTLDLPCRDVFARGQRPTEVVGPLLEGEAAALHEDVWKE